jgi:hypothetical protein
MVRAIGIDEIGPIGVEMPRVGGKFDRGADLVADQVHRVEVLRESDEIAIVAVIAGTPAPRAVVHVRRPGHEAEREMIVAERYAS